MEDEAADVLRWFVRRALVDRAEQLRIHRDARGLRAELVIGAVAVAEMRARDELLEPIVARLARLANVAGAAGDTVQHGTTHLRLVDGRRTSYDVQLEGQGPSLSAHLWIAPPREAPAAASEWTIDGERDDAPIPQLVNTLVASAVRRGARQIRIAHGRVDFQIATVWCPELEPTPALFAAVMRRFEMIGSVGDDDEGTTSVAMRVGNREVMLDLIFDCVGDARTVTILVQRDGARHVPVERARAYTHELVAACRALGADQLRLRPATSDRWALAEFWTNGTCTAMRPIPAWFSLSVQSDAAMLAGVARPARGDVAIGAVRLDRSGSLDTQVYRMRLEADAVTLAMRGNPSLPPAAPVALCRCGRQIDRTPRCARCASPPPAPTYRRLASPISFYAADSRRRVASRIAGLVAIALLFAVFGSVVDVVALCAAIAIAALVVAVTVPWRLRKLPRAVATCRSRRRRSP